MRARRPHRRKQLELLAHRRHHPGRIVARVGIVADRPHHPAVEFTQSALGRGWQRVAMLLVPALADWQRPPFDIEPRTRGGCLHHLDAFRYDFETDVIAQQNSNLQSTFSKPPVRSSVAVYTAGAPRCLRVHGSTTMWGSLMSLEILP